MIKGYIIDMDGTILDSMPIWDELSIRFLKHKGILANPNLKDILAPMSIDQAINYLINTYHLTQSPEELIKEVNNLLTSIYLNEVSLKPGAKEFINKCYQRNKKLCLLTANSYPVTISVLDKYGLTDKFDQIITGDSTTLDKLSGTIYEHARKALMLNNNECIVIEDAFHAISGAKRHNFVVWAVYDSSNKSNWEQICKLSDLYFNNMSEMEVI